MSSLSELYQNVILEHNRSPRNYRVMEEADRRKLLTLLRKALASAPPQPPWSSD